MDIRDPLLPPPSYPTSRASPSIGATRMYRVAKCPSDTLALTNLLIVSPSDFDPSIRHVLVDNRFAFSIRIEPGFPAGNVGTSLFHRRWASLSLNQDVSLRPYDPSQESSHFILATLDLEVTFLRKGTADVRETYDTEEMASAFLKSFGGQVMSLTQPIVFDFHGVNLQVVVKGMAPMSLDGLKAPESSAIKSRSVSPARGASPASGITRGVLVAETQVRFAKSPDSTIRLKGPARALNAPSILTPDFKFEDMGIGGLDVEFASIFRRAFASRIFPPSLVERLGIQHVRGILLYGPPGTGKTLMARQIGKMLNAREPKIVNGPEILNKFVGQSEENIRKLFADAEKEYQQKGDESGLHIVIFDELDAICRQRGSKNDGTGVGDSVVNQLLSKLDGVEQLNNILVIGMTNRLDMIDEALLRPGRLEVHMEISLPDEKGRLQILKIHTAKMKDNNLLARDVDFNELAILCKNFSGAEINGLVKSASSFAFNRHVKVGTLAGVAPDVEKLRVERADFLAALDEVKPAFGVNDEELQQCVQNKIIPFANHIERILADGQLFVEQVRNSQRTPLVSLLLHGPPGSGKTALAATIAMSSDFPFIKLISPENMVGYSETAKMAAINKVFNDSYKSPLSVIVIDCIERLLDWVAIGPRFSNNVLQTLLVLLKKRPPKDRRLLIIATTNQKAVLEQMDMRDAFDADIYVPNITSLDQVDAVLRDVALFQAHEREKARRHLHDAGLNKGVNIGVKKLLMVAEMARQDEDKVEKFVSTLLGV